MKISLKETEFSPEYPVMAGDTPLAKEFNKREQALWVAGATSFDYQQITTVLIEIFGDDYNARHAKRKKKK